MQNVLGEGLPRPWEKFLNSTETSLFFDDIYDVLSYNF